MRLLAISDLHLGAEINRAALRALAPHPNDWLILAGDIGETEEHLRFALETLNARFQRLLWTPGNHDLWTTSANHTALRGEAKYQRLVAICREYGVLTPEDPFVRWNHATLGGVTLAPIFTLYDYSFRPADVPEEKALEWAAETGVVCLDELLLFPDPFPSRAAWCAARCMYTARRLEQASRGGPLALIGHFPLRYDLVNLRRIPRFSLWCGTRQTEDWHVRFPVKTVVYGHLHIRGTHFRDGVRFEEVSFGYPRDWSVSAGMEPYLREILPAQDG